MKKAEMRVWRLQIESVRVFVLSIVNKFSSNQHVEVRHLRVESEIFIVKYHRYSVA